MEGWELDLELQYILKTGNSRKMGRAGMEGIDSRWSPTDFWK